MEAIVKINEHIHAVRIPFVIPVAPEKLIERVVYCYIVLGDRITLIDSGVAGAESIIFDCIRALGRDPEDVVMLILSHSHPDHLGAARALKTATNCKVLAHPAEKEWIEDTERQFRERPVPGFHKLVGGPVAVDGLLVDGQALIIEENITCKVIHTPGHSSGSISLFFEDEGTLFSGDSLPLPGDLPIYENIVDCRESIEKLRRCGSLQTLLSSWEAPIQGTGETERRIEDGISYLRMIHESVLKAAVGGPKDLMELCRHVVRDLGLPPFAANPLVAGAFASSLEAGKKPVLLRK